MKLTLELDGTTVTAGLEGEDIINTDMMTNLLHGLLISAGYTEAFVADVLLVRG